MTETPAFRINLGDLKKRNKAGAPDVIEKADQAGETHGFVDRTPKKRRGRPPSPRTGQVHAKVLPHVSSQIAQEAKRRGVQQGVLIEEAWVLYCAHTGLDI